MGDTQKRILILEDELPLAKALELKLSKEGFLVEKAQNGDEALLILSKENFDLILLDIVMPKMDGFTFVKKVNELKLDVPMVVLSNLGQSSDIAKAKELGVKEFFIKSNTPLTKIVDYAKKMLA